MAFLTKLGSFFVTASTNRTLSLLVILGVVLAIPLTVYVAQQQQEIRQQALEFVTPCDEEYNSCPDGTPFHCFVYLDSQGQCTDRQDCIDAEAFLCQEESNPTPPPANTDPATPTPQQDSTTPPAPTSVPTTQPEQPIPTQSSGTNQCTYPQACFDENDQQGVQECTGVYNASQICVWDDTGTVDPNCTPCRVSEPTPTPPSQCPVVAPVGGFCMCDVPGYDLVDTRCKNWNNNTPTPTATPQPGGGGSSGGSGGSGGSRSGGGGRTTQPTTRPATTATSPTAVPPLRDKTCSVNWSISGNNVWLQYGGNAFTSGSQPVRLQVSSINPAERIPQLAEFEKVYSGQYYYLIDSCESTDGNPCQGTKTITLPKGSFSLFCDLPFQPNRCSGNPVCTYNGGSVTCTDWKSCSGSDHRIIQISSNQPSGTPSSGTTGTVTPIPGTEGSGGIGASTFQPCDLGLSCITPPTPR